MDLIQKKDVSLQSELIQIVLKEYEENLIPSRHRLHQHPMQLQ